MCLKIRRVTFVHQTPNKLSLVCLNSRPTVFSSYATSLTRVAFSPSFFLSMRVTLPLSTGKIYANSPHVLQNLCQFDPIVRALEAIYAARALFCI